MPPSLSWWAPLVVQMVKRLSAMQETQVWSLGWEDPLEKEMAAHFSILAWKIPWTAELGSLWGCKELDMIEQLHFHSLSWYVHIVRISASGWELLVMYMFKGYEDRQRL